jgi:hypothetical protein
MSEIITTAFVLMSVALGDQRGLPAARWYLDAQTCRAALVETISANVLRDAWCQEVQLRSMRPVTMEGIER